MVLQPPTPAPHAHSSASTRNRRGRALSLKGNHDEAEADFYTAAAADPSCAAEMEKEVVANQQRAKTAERKQRSEMKNFLSRR